MKTNLTTIKIIHTIIWFFFNVVLFYMAYAVIVNKIDRGKPPNNFPEGEIINAPPPPMALSPRNASNER